MTKISRIIFILTFIIYSSVTTAEQKTTTSVTLKYIIGQDVLSVLKSLIDQSISIREENNVLHIYGTPDKTKNILHIINAIDSPPASLTIEFLASSRVISFNKNNSAFNKNRTRNKLQSMSITERQWVTLNTGLSIPISIRRKNPDGTESQFYKYKKISESYLFKVHEFSGWSVIQVGINTQTLNNDIEKAISNTNLDTIIVGKTGEWLEIVSSQNISNNKRKRHAIHLYVKVLKLEENNEIKPVVPQ